jgi:hypothetical protein
MVGHDVAIALVVAIIDVPEKKSEGIWGIAATVRRAGTARHALHCRHAICNRDAHETRDAFWAPASLPTCCCLCQTRCHRDGDQMESRICRGLRLCGSRRGGSRLALFCTCAAACGPPASADVLLCSSPTAHSVNVPSPLLLSVHGTSSTHFTSCCESSRLYLHLVAVISAATRSSSSLDTQHRMWACKLPRNYAAAAAW